MPKTNDPEQMRCSSEQVVRLKDLTESLPSEEQAHRIQEASAHTDLFGNFGTDIDQTGGERLARLKHTSDELKRRQAERLLDR